MSETRKIAAILAADVVGYSRLVGADEDRTLARLRALRSDLIDPTIALHHGRTVKRTGDGSIIEFRSVVDAVRCAIEVQTGMVERNAGVSPDKRIEFRVGIHLGDVVEETDGDLMGDGVNIAARLESIAKPGAICLSEQAYWQVKSRLDLKVSDLGEAQLKNIAEPIRVYSLEIDAPAHAKPAPSSTTTAKQESGTRARPSPWSLGWPGLAAIAALLLLAAGGRWTMLSDRLTKSAQAAHLSIVVLPFTNLSGDSSQDYFADGVTENLTTELSRIKDSFVIAPSTAFTFKGKSVDAKEFGKQLGVRYVLAGSVQRDGAHVRVNAQLVDAETGAHLWADRFEEDVADLFKLQDEVVARLAHNLGWGLIYAEGEKAGRSQNPDAVDLAMRGWTLVHRSSLRPAKERLDSVHEARFLFDQALKSDPSNAEALAGSARVYGIEYAIGQRDPGTDYDAKVLEPTNRAIALDPNNIRAYYTKAEYLVLSRRASEALSAADAGLAVNPNDAVLLLARADAENALGRYEQAKADMESAIRLSPRDPIIAYFHVIVGDAEIGLGHFDAAIDEFRKALDAGLHAFSVYMPLAAAYALAGKVDEAKAALAEARRLEPKLTVKWMTEYMHNPPAVLDGVRKAGLAEE
jgi:adenylate cyclase